MLALSITLVTAFLCVFMPVTVSALTSDDVEGVTKETYLESLDVDYYVTSNGNSGTFTLTGSFKMPDGEAVTADPVYSGTCVPASGTTTSQNMQSCNLTPRVNGVNTTYGHHVSEITFDDSASLTLTGSLGNVSQTVTTKYSYVLKTVNTFSFKAPVSGTLLFTVNPTSWADSNLRFKGVNCQITVISNSDGTYTLRIRPNCCAVFSVEAIMNYSDRSSMTIASLYTLSSGYADYSGLDYYVADVSDSNSHSLLSDILDLLNNNSGTSSTNDAINDATSDLVDQGDLMHGTEVNLQNAMDTALSDQALNVDINQKIQSDSKVSSSFNWVGSQLTYIVQGFNDITPYWEFMFIMPLVLGIGLLIIGRLR